MNETIRLQKINEVYFRIYANPGIIDEMHDHFSFRPKNFQFDPRFKANAWDGYLHLVDRRYNTIYRGLIKEIEKFAKEREYGLEHDDVDKEAIDNQIIDDFISTLKLPFPLRDAQLNCIRLGINEHKRLFLSPTSSGKSLILYVLTRYWKQERDRDKKALIIVPRINLITQMHGDFLDYARNDPVFNSSFIHEICAGHEKYTDKPIVISTWQSLYQLDRAFFEQFDFVCCDEAHNAKADSLKKILSNCTAAEWRFGMTGTLDESKCNEMVIQGLTGPVYQATTTKEEIAKNNIAQMNPITCLVMKYTEEEANELRKFAAKKENKKEAYRKEIEFIISNERRNKFIRNLAIDLKGNTIIMFQFVQKHGRIIYDLIFEKLKGTDRKVFFVHGGTDNEDRELVRTITEQESNAIIVASVGVFGTGTNIKKLDNLIFASPSKSLIRVLQCIGRILRLSTKDKVANVFDMADDLTSKRHKNFGVKHLLERTKIYDKQGFEYRIVSVKLYNKAS